MTYIDYLNDFNKWLRSNHLPGNARLLYYSLLAIFNEAGWPESVQVDNYRLMSMIDVRTERVAISTRDKLVDCGFIRYSKGKKGSPNTYFLTRYTCEKVSQFGSESGSVKCSHIKTKTKKKNPPQPPRGVEEVSQPTYQPEWFERFWALYPRKTNRKQTVKTWDKLKPSLDLCRVMAAALRAQMGTEQWQDPQAYSPSVHLAERGALE